MTDNSNSEIVREMNVWGYLIVAFQLAMFTHLSPSDVLSSFAALFGLFALCGASAWNNEGYARTAWRSIGFDVPRVSRHE